MLFVCIHVFDLETEKTFVGIASIPQDSELHEAKLFTEWEDEPTETLSIQARYGLYGRDSLEVLVEKLRFLLIYNPKDLSLFGAVGGPQDISNKWRFAKTSLRVGAVLTSATNKAMVYGLIRQYPGRTAPELKKLFGVPVGKTLNYMLNRGWIRREPVGAGRYRYYLLER